jgi:peptide/nickel transport system ATP-binding protein
MDKVAVMYAGKLVEISTVPQMFTRPLHPYAQSLIDSLPNLDNKGVLKGIPGLAPSLLRVPSGCSFHPRCAQAIESCKSVVPFLKQNAEGRWVSCLLYEDQK